VLFERKISARKFATTHVDVFHETVEETVMNQYDQIADQVPGDERGLGRQEKGQ
jgi:disulfide oxidoreductase YuzD